MIVVREIVIGYPYWFRGLLTSNEIWFLRVQFSLWIPWTLLSRSCANWQMFRVSLTLRFLLLGRQVCNFVTAEYLQFCNSLTFLLCIHSRPHWWGAENPFSIQISFSWPTLVQGLGNQLLCKCWRALHTLHTLMQEVVTNFGELYFVLVICVVMRWVLMIAQNLSSW